MFGRKVAAIVVIFLFDFLHGLKFARRSGHFNKVR